MIGIRMHGTRQSVSVPVVNVWYYDNKKRVLQTMRERTAAQKAKRASNKLEQLNGQ
jgi:hypothetical protein